MQYSLSTNAAKTFRIASNSRGWSEGKADKKIISLDTVPMIVCLIYNNQWHYTIFMVKKYSQFKTAACSLYETVQGSKTFFVLHAETIEGRIIFNVIEGTFLSECKLI